MEIVFFLWLLSSKTGLSFEILLHISHTRTITSTLHVVYISYVIPPACTYMYIIYMFYILTCKILSAFIQSSEYLCVTAQYYTHFNISIWDTRWKCNMNKDLATAYSELACNTIIYQKHVMLKAHRHYTYCVTSCYSKISTKFYHFFHQMTQQAAHDKSPHVDINAGFPLLKYGMLSK